MTNDEVIKRVQDAYKKSLSTLMVVVGNEMVNFSKESFGKQGWLDNSFSPWKKRKGKKGANRAILVKSARLKRSIRVTKITADTVSAGTDVPYAKAHNEGFRGTVAVRFHKRNKFKKSKMGTGKLTKKGVERMKTVKSISGSTEVKAHMRRMNIPKRKFLGSSQYLMIRLKRVGLAHIAKNL